MSKYKTYHVTIEAITDIICSPRGSNQKINGIDFTNETSEGIKWNHKFDEKRVNYFKNDEQKITIIYPAYFNGIDYYIPGSTIKGNLLKNKKNQKLNLQVSDFILENPEKSIELKNIYKIINLYRNNEFTYYFEKTEDNKYFLCGYTNKKKLTFLETLNKNKVKEHKVEIEKDQSFKFTLSNIDENSKELEIKELPEEKIDLTNKQKIRKTIRKADFFANNFFEVYKKSSKFKGKIRIKGNFETLLNFKLTDFSFNYELTKKEYETKQKTEDIKKEYTISEMTNNLLAIGGFRGFKNAFFDQSENDQSGIYLTGKDSEESIIGIVKMEETK